MRDYKDGNVVDHPAAQITQPLTFPRHGDTSSSTRYNSTIIMPIYTQEDKIILAIEAIRTSRKKLSQRAAARMYDVPQQTLNNRINNRPRREKTRVKDRKLDSLEEQTLVRYIIEQDERGFLLRLAGMEDMANLLLQSRGGEPVGKKWARRFMDTQPSLKTKFARLYNYQRALCEDPTVVSGWFALLRNMMAKYGI